MSATVSRWSALSTKQAFCIHLALSFLIFFSLVAVMFTLWFPGELFFLDGGWQGLKLVALVDLVLGPALTLMLYKPGKPGLVLDMSLIAAFQIAALAYGFYATHSQRTVAMVYSERAFSSLSADALAYAEENLRERNIQATNNINALDDGRPAVVIAPEPSKDQMNTYLEELLNGFPEGHERFDRFEAASQHQSFLKNTALDDEQLEEEGRLENIGKAIKKLGLDRNEIQLHRFKTRYAKGVVIYDPQSNTILDYVPNKDAPAVTSAEQ